TVQHHVSGEKVIAGGGLIGTLAGQHDLEIVGAYVLAQQVFGDAVGIWIDRLTVPDSAGEVVDDLIRGYGENVMMRTGKFGALCGYLRFVKGFGIERNSEGMHRD